MRRARAQTDGGTFLSRPWQQFLQSIPQSRPSSHGPSPSVQPGTGSPAWTAQGWSLTSPGRSRAYAQPGTGARGQPGQGPLLPDREDKEDMWVAAG